MYPKVPDFNVFGIIVERSGLFLFLILVRSPCQTCLESTWSSTSEWGLSDRDLQSINNDKSRSHTGIFLPEISIYTHTVTHSWGVSVGTCCPFSEATVTKATFFFEKSSSPLSPVPHRRNAEGDVCQRTRADAIYSALLSSGETQRAGRGQFTGTGINQK